MPASPPAPAASPDTLAAAHSAFGADLPRLLDGTESAEASAPPDGSTAGPASNVQTDASRAGTEQPTQPGQPGQARVAGATGKTDNTGTTSPAATREVRSVNRRHQPSHTC